jgi:hypothetical protein
MATIILYFAPHFPDAREIVGAVIIIVTMLFPLLIVGNLRSIQEPRTSRTSFGEGLVLALGMVAFASVCAIPAIIMTTVGGSIIASTVYASIVAGIWFGWSVPRTARAAAAGRAEVTEYAEEA